MHIYAYIYMHKEKKKQINIEPAVTRRGPLVECRSQPGVCGGMWVGNRVGPECLHERSGRKGRKYAGSKTPAM